jgi:hypothetical protein
MEAQMDPMREQFEEIRREGPAFIERVVAEAWQEGPSLDFKTAGSPMTKDDKKNLAEAMSGFANSDGGLIVWGVCARSDGADDPDAAKEKQPIQRLNRFLSDLHQLTPQLVSPAVIGVEHIAILDPRSPDTGYAVTLIPKSEGLPHMARAGKQHTFYFRSGSSFLPMEPFMLADRYSRRPQPKLEFEWRIEPGGTTGGPNIDKIELRVFFGIKNSGAGIAMFPAIIIHSASSLRINPYRYRMGLPEQTAFAGEMHNGRRIFGGGADYVVYPGSTLEITYGSYTFDRASTTIPDQTISFELYCDGFSCAGRATIPLDEEFQKMKAVPRG